MAFSSEPLIGKGTVFLPETVCEVGEVRSVPTEAWVLPAQGEVAELNNEREMINACRKHLALGRRLLAACAGGFSLLCSP